VADPTLLIVEDDPATGSSLERALSNQRYRCVMATSMSQARAVSNRPSLVLLDLGLPDGDGLDLAGEMIARWPGIPIVMLSARAREADVVVGLDAGAVDYVTKPFRLLELLTRVRTHLGHTGPRQSGADRPNGGDPDPDGEPTIVSEPSRRRSRVRRG
jgi:DNA-binding response OmpR family regulator